MQVHAQIGYSEREQDADAVATQKSQMAVPIYQHCDQMQPDSRAEFPSEFLLRAAVYQPPRPETKRENPEARNP